MNKVTKKFIILLGILILAAVLRFYHLNYYPALNADEAALGYNAYSLLKTGKDEHGNPWPLQFQSFNDYKPGLTVYMIMPFVALFGLNEWSVRFLPALLGVLSVYVMYLLAKEVGSSLIKGKRSQELFPFLAAFMLAVSPWHIHFSRGAWEVNIATFFIMLGVLFFFRSLKKSRELTISLFFFTLSLYTYHAARVIVPLIALVLVALYAKKLYEARKAVIVAVVCSVIVGIPLGLSFVTQGGLSRAGGVALWADFGPENRVNELRGSYSSVSNPLGKLLHNKPTAYGLQFLNNWSEHFTGEFLFLSGDDIQRNKVPETGQLYMLELPILLIGIYAVFKKLTKKWMVVFAWLAIAPVAAALTFQSPHALRSESMIIPLELISAYGLMTLDLSLRSFFKKRNVYYVLHAILIVLICWSVVRYLHLYYVHMSKEYPYSSQYGVKELVTYLKPVYKNYPNVVVTDRYDQPYILFLFYLQYEPSVFQKEHTLTSRDQYGFSTVRSFSNFKFESIDPSTVKELYPKSLIVGTEKEIRQDDNIIKDIYGTNDYRYFRILAN